jgi:hypothetical protein
LLINSNRSAIFAYKYIQRSTLNMAKKPDLAQQADDAVAQLMKLPGANIYDVATAAALNFYHSATPLAQAIMARADELAGSLAECLEIQRQGALADAEELAWRTRY